MEIYRLNLLTEDDDGVEKFLHFWCDVTKISAWYIPTKEFEHEESTLNIVFDGGLYTVRQDENILEYLKIKFVNNARI
jgi:hypothetical protein